MLREYGTYAALGALLHRRLMLFTLICTVALNVYLYIIVPKGFMPQQDTGRLQGNLIGDQSISFQAMQTKLASFVSIIREDPGVDHVVAFTGGGQRNGAFFFVILKPIAERSKFRADVIIGRLAQKPGPGARRNPFPASCTGRPGRRTRFQRPIPVHAQRGRSERIAGVGT